VVIHESLDIIPSFHNQLSDLPAIELSSTPGIDEEYREVL
jgi:hypothetical protein